MPGNIFDQFEEEVNQLTQLTSARVTRNRLPQILRMNQESSTRQNSTENPSNGSPSSRVSPLSQEQPPEIIVHRSPGHEHANTQPCYVSLPRINIPVPSAGTNTSGSANNEDPSQSYPSHPASPVEVAAPQNPVHQPSQQGASSMSQLSQNTSQRLPCATSDINPPRLNDGHRVTSENPAPDTSTAQLVKHMSDMLATMFARYDQLQQQTSSTASVAGNMSKPMRRSIPKFSGRSDSSVEEWISIFSILTEDYSEKDTKISFAESLTDYAQKWYIRNYEIFGHKSSKDWLKLLKSAFYRTKDERLDALWRIQWKENDSPRQFIRFLEDEAASLGEDVIGIATLLKITKNALKTHPEYPRFADKIPNSMSHILNMLLLHAPKEGEAKDPCPVLQTESTEENLLTQSQGSAQYSPKANKQKRFAYSNPAGQNRQTSDRNLGHQNPAPGGPPFFAGECRYCKIFGHKIRDCPIRPPQHFLRSMPQQQQYNQYLQPNPWPQRMPYPLPVQMQPQYPVSNYQSPRQRFQQFPRQQYFPQGYRGRNPGGYSGYNYTPPAHTSSTGSMASNSYGGSTPFYPATSNAAPSQPTISSTTENPGPSHIPPVFPRQGNSNGLN